MQDLSLIPIYIFSLPAGCFSSCRMPRSSSSESGRVSSTPYTSRF